MKTVEQAVNRPGTPQAAGVKFEDVVREIQARNRLVVLAGRSFMHRRPGESRDDFALRLQIADTRPVLASGVLA